MWTCEMYQEKGARNVVKIKREQREQGELGNEGSGEILLINPLDYQTEKLSYKTPGSKTIFSREQGNL